MFEFFQVLKSPREQSETTGMITCNPIVIEKQIFFLITGREHGDRIPSRNALTENLEDGNA